MQIFTSQLNDNKKKKRRERYQPKRGKRENTEEEDNKQQELNNSHLKFQPSNPTSIDNLKIKHNLIHIRMPRILPPLAHPLILIPMRT